MNPKDLNHYSGVVNQPPLRWGRMKKWLFHISHAPSYAPEPEQKPVCRQFSRCKDCPYCQPPVYKHRDHRRSE